MGLRARPEPKSHKRNPDLIEGRRRLAGTHKKSLNRPGGNATGVTLFLRRWVQSDWSGDEERGNRDEHGIGPFTSDAVERGIDLAAGVRVEHLDLQPERASGRFHVSQCDFRYRPTSRIDEDGHTSHAGHQLTQELQLLRRQLDHEKVVAGQVAARPGEALDQTMPDRVVADIEDGYPLSVRSTREGELAYRSRWPRRTS